jgi:tetratricopeptide (TPR) repeat protein
VGRAEEGEQVAERAYSFATALADPTLLARAVFSLGYILYLRAKNELAQGYLEQAAELSAQIGDVKLLANVRKFLGTTLRRLGHYDLARHNLYQALKVFEEQGDYGQQISVLTPLGISYSDQRQFAQAEACYERSLRLSRQIGSPSGEARELSNLAVLYGAVGKPAQGLEAVEQSIAIHKALGDPVGEAIVTNIYANLLQERLGDYERATVQVNHSLSLAQQTNSVYVIGDALEIKGDIALSQGDLIESRRCYTEALSKAGNQVSVIHSTLGLGKSSLPTSAVEGLAQIEQAEKLAGELGIKDYQVKAMALRAQVLAEQGQLDDALMLADAAAQMLRDNAMWDHTVHYARYQILNAHGHTALASAALEQARTDMLSQLQDLGPEQLKHSLAQVPDHRRIVRAWEVYNVQRQTVRLPKAEAPTGRPLREDEYIEVDWTVSVPTDNQIQGKTERRQTQLNRLVAEAKAQGAAPTLGDLAEALASSKATVKRDLAALRSLGVELRTRGTRG